MSEPSALALKISEAIQRRWHLSGYPTPESVSVMAEDIARAGVADLEATLAQQRKTIDMYRALAMPDGTKWGEVLDERDALRAERDVLRIKLRDMADARWHRMDAEDAKTGGRSLGEVCDSERALRDRLAAVEALHVPRQPHAVMCAECDVLWPCPTVRAARGETEEGA